MKVLVDDIYTFETMGDEPRVGFRRGYFKRDDINDVGAVDFMMIEDSEIEAIYPDNGCFDVKIKNIQEPITCHYKLITISEFTKCYGDFIRSHPSVELRQDMLKKLWITEKVEWPKTKNSLVDEWNKFCMGLMHCPIDESLFTELTKDLVFNLYNKVLSLKILVPYYDDEGYLQRWNPDVKPLKLEIKCEKPLIKYNEDGGFKYSFDEGRTWEPGDGFCYDYKVLSKLASTICFHMNDDTKFLFNVLGLDKFKYEIGV